MYDSCFDKLPAANLIFRGLKCEDIAIVHISCFAEQIRWTQLTTHPWLD